MTYLSVCSGIEAATVAWHPLGWTPCAFSEIDKFPSAVLKHHYPPGGAEGRRDRMGNSQIVENLDRLAQALRDTPDADFDYRLTCRCVIPIARQLFRMTKEFGVVSPATGVTFDFGRYIEGSFDAVIERGGLDGKDWRLMNVDEAHGAAGKTEALRRIAIVRARYAESPA